MNSTKRTPLRCRLFGHDWRDTVTGWSMPHFFIPSAEGPTIVRHYRCTRCQAERTLR